MLISVVIPAYNEERTLETLLQRVLAARDPSQQWEVVLVDDGSTDRTAEIARRFLADVKLITLDRNHGKGTALRKGFAAAHGEVIIIQDADLEYDPAEYAILLEPVLGGTADVVFGSRFVSNRPRRVIYFWHYVGNKFLTLLANLAANLNLSDMETGHKVIRREFLRRFELCEERFGIEPELTIKLARAGARIYEVGISYHGRTYAEGKKPTWRDGLAAVGCIVKYGLCRSSRIPSPVREASSEK